MYRRIVVALDGSEVAEQVLPPVEALAERFGSLVVLLRVTRWPECLRTPSMPTAARPTTT